MSCLASKLMVCIPRLWGRSVPWRKSLIYNDLSTYDCHEMSNDACKQDQSVPKRRGRRPGTGKLLSPSDELSLRDRIRGATPRSRCLDFKKNTWTWEAVESLVKSSVQVPVISRQLVMQRLSQWGIPNNNSAQFIRSKDIELWWDKHESHLKDHISATRGVLFWLAAPKQLRFLDWKVPDPNTKKKLPANLTLLAAADSHGKVYWRTFAGAKSWRMEYLFLRGLQLDHDKRIFCVALDETSYRSQKLRTSIKKMYTTRFTQTTRPITLLRNNDWRRG